MTISALIIFLSILFVLVVVHEFGHFLFAKIFKIRVDEFAFGFPPRLLKYKFGETLYSFNLIPLGGYVKIFGENGIDDEDKKNLSHQEMQRSFASKSPWKRILVLSGGVIFNILAAIILFSIALMYGSNIYLTNDEVATTNFEERNLQVVDINEKSPLQSTIIRVGDKIIGLESDGEILRENGLSSYSATEFVQKHNNSIISITFTNQTGEVNSVAVVPKAGMVEGKKILGAKFADSSFKKYGFFEAIYQSLDMTFFQLKNIFISLYDMVKNIIYKDARVEDSISGPVGLAILTSKVASKGADQIFFFAALLSLSLAVFNILPIPALDGGRILFVLIEITTGKKVKKQVEQLFHGLGFLALLFLMVFVTYFDIVKAFAG